VRVAQKSARYQPIRIRSSQRNKVRKSGGGGAQSGGGGGEGSSIYNATCTAACHVSWPKERAAMLDAVRSNRMPPEDSGKKLSADERSALIAYLSK
jgi:cytochrome c5